MTVFKEPTRISRAGNVSLLENYYWRFYSSIYFISSFHYKNNSSNYTNKRISLLYGIELKLKDLFMIYDEEKWASVISVVLRRPRTLVSSLWGGKYCFYFSKPERSHSRLLAKTFPRCFVELRRCKSINAWIPPAGQPKVSRDSSVVLRTQGFVVFSGFKRQSDTVDAESLACWLWSVIKHVSQMCVTLE